MKWRGTMKLSGGKIFKGKANTIKVIHFFLPLPTKLF